MAGFDDFRGRVASRQPYRFTVDGVHAMAKLGIIGWKGCELLDGMLLMRGADVPVRLHSSDLSELYEAGVIPGEVETEMIEGVIYLRELVTL